MPFNPSDYEDINLDRYQTYLDSCIFETNILEKQLKILSII